MSNLKFVFINQDKEKIIEDELKNSLKIIGKLYFFEDLVFITKELINNANRANMKQAYLNVNKINMNSPEAYNEHIKNFKKEIDANPNQYLDELSRLGLNVGIDFKIESNHFIITVTNNRQLLKIEKDRIKNKFDEAKKFAFLNENLLNCIDTSEGGGLGIILIILMLRKIGLDDSYLKIIDHENSTDSIIMIPLTALEKKQEFAIAEIAQKEIEDIPQLPEHIVALQEKLNDPNSSFHDLSEIIKIDPSLIAELLKISNSGIYILTNKVKTIEEAIKIIGFNGIKNLVLAYKAKKILIERYTEALVKNEIEHANLVALYSYEVIRHINFSDTGDEMYTAAILHDIGKIIIKSIHPNLIEKIVKICNSKGININIAEKFTEGFNHSIIGSLLAEKWKFSEIIIDVIRNHHSPLECSDKYKGYVYAVYLANVMCYYNKNEIFYVNIDNTILNHFNIKNENQFNDIINKIENNIQERQKD